MTDISPQDREKIIAPLYKKVFFGNSTPQEGMLVFMDLLNISEALRDHPENNASVYRHMGSRSVGLRLLRLSEFTEADGSLGLQGISKLHVTIDDAAKLLKALTEAYLNKQGDLK